MRKDENYGNRQKYFVSMSIQIKKVIANQMYQFGMKYKNIQRMIFLTKAQKERWMKTTKQFSVTKRN